MKRQLLAATVAASLSACGQQSAELGDAPVSETGDSGAAELVTDEDRAFYALGARLADNIADLRLSEAELERVAAGMRDSVLGEPLEVDVEAYLERLGPIAEARMAEAAEEEKAASTAFADEIAAEPGAERLDNGAIVVPMTEGDGENPAETDTVTVHYHGSLRDGTVFDSSVERGQPATFALQGVIPCWTEGVQQIRVGGKARLLCPSDTAYGDAGRPPTIPGGAALLFEVELLAIEDE